MKLLIHLLSFFLILSIIPPLMAQTPTILHEQDNNYSSSYHETISFFEELSKTSDIIKMSPFGMTDAGYPLHEIIVDLDQEFDPNGALTKTKTILMINNGIHPGEPCGIDASQQLIRDIIINKIDRSLLNNTIIVMIPIYNIGGSLNRGSHSRANQLGPRDYGFRGNAKNLDLNRDFIKCDSKNAQSFNAFYNKWNPPVFVDTHTSNGADYQYTMTLIPTQKDRLSPVISKYMTESMIPDLYDQMNRAGWEMTPYVYADETPDSGIAGFMDYARYSSGYAATHHALSFMPETHMLKPYKDRVASTYEFLKATLIHVHNNTAMIQENFAKAKKEYALQTNATIDWTINKDRVDSFLFKGYEAGYKQSLVTGKQRLYYDRSKPYTKNIAFYNSYKALKNITIPKAYVIPQAYHEVIQRLQWNGVEMARADKDQIMNVEMYHIDNYESRTSPYEGHYMHHGVVTSVDTVALLVHKGDYIIATNQDKVRYIVETLEPEAPDSFFAWNFFDGILMQKEYFSAYVFEDLAAELLESDAQLKTEFYQKKKTDPSFAEDARAQLFYIYKRSPHYEKTYRRYPIGRVMK